MVKKTRKIEPTINRFINQLKKKYRVQAVYIYGSYSKGNASKWSDIDIAVISPDFSEDRFEERLNLMKIAARIDDRLEPHPFRSADFEFTNPLVNEIYKNGFQVL